MEANLTQMMSAPAAVPAAQVQLKMASELSGFRVGSSTMAAIVADQSIVHVIPSELCTRMIARAPGEIEYWMETTPSRASEETMENPRESLR
jgi:hypothetical protein